MSDPWRRLDDTSLSPQQADAVAREEIGRFAPTDPRRGAGMAVWLAARAAGDGSTALPTGVLTAALRAYGLPDPVPGIELAAGEGRLVTLDDERLVALPSIAAAEEEVAAEALRLLGNGRLRLVVEPGRQAHRHSLPELATLLREAAGAVVLSGDPDALEPASPGRGFGDLLRSGLVPVDLAPASESGTLAEVRQSVRAGTLPAVPADQREFVVVPCQDAAAVLHRAAQLVESSLPRLLGQRAALVLTVREEGAAGAAALRRRLGDLAEVRTVAQAVSRRSPGVVLVLPGEAAGSLTRALLVSALEVAEQHASVIHQVGAALVTAVASRPHRPRLTRLGGLLRGMAA